MSYGVGVRNTPIAVRSRSGRPLTTSLRISRAREEPRRRISGLHPRSMHQVAAPLLGRGLSVYLDNHADEWTPRTRADNKALVAKYVSALER